MKQALLFAMLCCAVPLRAQFHDLEIGVMGAATLNMHRGSFSTSSGLDECGTFSDALTPGLMIGNDVLARIGDRWGVSGRLFYYRADGSFTSPTGNIPRVRLADGTLVPLVSEYALTTDLDYIGLEALGKYFVIPDVYVAAGPQVGYAMRTAFEQREDILSPSNLRFSNGSSSRVILAGSFERTSVDVNRQLRLGITAAVGMDLTLAGNWRLHPEVGFTYGLTNVLSTFDWKVHTIRAGVTLGYVLNAPAAVIVTEAAPPPPPPPPIPAMPANVALNIEGASSITITETRRSDLFPLLPYVFFDHTSSVIPARYRDRKGETQSFDPLTAADSGLASYHDMLNIVGQRLRERPNARITLTGHREPADGEASATLPMERAVAVRDYLQRVWNVEPSRMDVAARELPSVISNRNTDDGRAENRRVEITTNDPAIVAPIQRRTIRRETDPDTVQLIPLTQPASAFTDAATIRIMAPNGRVLMDKPYRAALQASVPWTPNADDIASILGTAQRVDLIAELTATENDGTSRKATRTIPVRSMIRSARYDDEIVNDSTVERFSLIFFDYDTPTISTFNTTVMDLIRARCRTTSTVRITGLTDRTGNPTYNEDLSRRRAASVADAIKARIIPNAIESRGLGPNLLFDNDLPEGRFYNRTVLVEVVTPLDR